MAPANISSMCPKNTFQNGLWYALFSVYMVLDHTNMAMSAILRLHMHVLEHLIRRQVKHSAIPAQSLSSKYVKIHKSSRGTPD